MVPAARSRKLALTLFCTLALALLLVQPAAATADPVLNRREHAGLSRMIRKRAPDGILGLTPIENAGAGGDSGGAAAGGSGTTSAGQASNTAGASASTPATSPTSSGVPTSSGGGLLDTLTSALGGGSTSSLPSSAPSTTSTSSSSIPTTSSTPTVVAPTSTPPTSAPASQTPVGNKTITSLLTPTSSATSNTDASTNNTPTGATSLSKGATTVLIVIGACVGGGAIIWTIFRKWKLRASSRFEDRLEPIDWQPSTDAGLPSSNRPISVASSFHSAGHDGLMRSNSGNGGYGATSLNPIPDHDFTAGGGSLAPGGYADMARGPSPGPQMMDIHRGPSPSMQQYDTYGASLHHQGGTGYPAQAGDYYNAPRY